MKPFVPSMLLRGIPGTWLVFAGAVAAQPTPPGEAAFIPPIYVNTAFENASPLYWEVEADGTTVLHLVYDQERASPNRANGHWHYELEGVPGSRVRLAHANFYNVYNGNPANPIRGDRHFAFVSEDGTTWRPVSAVVDEQRRFVVELNLADSSLFVASVEPYGLGHLDRLLADVRDHPRVEVDTIGATVEGRPLEMIRAGRPDAPHRVLIRARAHPWEPGGNWVVDGLLRALVQDVPENRAFLDDHVLWIMPMANKDGVARGKTRFNSRGIDLNRGWERPADPRLAPENAALERWLERRIAEGRAPDLALELHNDKEGQLHLSRPTPNGAADSAAYAADAARFERLLRAHTWFTEGSRTTGNRTTLPAGLLDRYGISGVVFELHALWIAGLQEPASARAWMELGAGLRDVLTAYFQEDPDVR